MKNLLKLFAVVLCLLFSLPASAEEKINNFEVHFNLQEDNTATVKEYITFTSEHNQIKRGLFRVLPKNIKVESLTLNGKNHPYNKEEGLNTLKINFGTDELLETGEHNYIFTYTLNNVIKPTLTHDALHWPVTGGAWDLPIDKVSFYLTVPFSVKPINKKIIDYINEEKDIKFNRLAENIFKFETARLLKKGEVLNISFPVKKGVFKYRWYEIKYMPVFVCLLIILYYFIIWYLVGRDPEEKLFATKFSPPKNVSAGFASYFLNGPFSSKNLATVLASLIVKKRIKITFPKKGAPKCEKTEDAEGVLEEDEIRMLMCLPPEFELNKDAYTYLEKGLLSINYYYESQIDNYVINNFAYMLFPIAAFIGMLFYFHSRGVLPTILIAMVFNFLIPIIIGVYTKNIKKLLWIILFFIIGIGVGVSSFLSPKFLLNPNVIAIITTVFMTALFAYLVNNLMLDGAILRDELAAFKRYMFTAEKGRVALSKPSEADQIFCDYLPYAYAFGMESKWFKKFKSKIDFHLQEDYEALTNSSALDMGLFMTISSIMAKGKENLISSNIIAGIAGKGGLGGGGR